MCGLCLRRQPPEPYLNELGLPLAEQVLRIQVLPEEPARSAPHPRVGQPGEIGDFYLGTGEPQLTDIDERDRAGVAPFRPFDELSLLGGMGRLRAGRPVALPRLRADGPVLSEADTAGDDLRRLVAEQYEGDYRFLAEATRAGLIAAA